MDSLEPKPPPAPPRPEWVKPPPASAPAPAAASMLEFLQQRAEALERELALERERAQSAQSLLAHQETLRSEVDAHLKAMTEQLKREKLERDEQEARSHSRGRVEALEKRLDETNATFAQVLKEAVSARDAAPAAETLGAALAPLALQIRTLGERLERDEKFFEENVARRFDEMGATFARLLSGAVAARDGAPALSAALAPFVEQLRGLNERPPRDEKLEERLGRLDETLASLARSVKEVGAPTSAPTSALPSASLTAELSALRETFKEGMDGLGRWRGELRELTALVPQVQGISERLPRTERLLAESVGRRLDEMDATFARLLKEAVASSGRAELSALGETLKQGTADIGRWGEELRDLASLAPRVQSLLERLPRDERPLEESVGRRLDEFGARLARSLEDAKRAQEAGRAEQDARVEALARERADLARAWETQARVLREEQFKERLAREAESSRQVGELAARVSALAAAQDGSRLGFDGVRQDLERVLSLLTATPAAKDLSIAALEEERDELLRLARDRQDALSRFAEERREVEKSLGDGLLKLTAELEGERARTRAAEARANESRGVLDGVKPRLDDLNRAVADREARTQSLAAERDELARAFVAEAERARLSLEERRAAEAAAEARLAELRGRLDEAAARRAAAESAASDARGQMAALAEQTARTLQERDSVVARFSDWEAERRRLLDTIRKKDEMISMLSATFQGALKKGP